MKVIKRPSRELWWEIAGACEYSTFFHTPLWSELVTGAFPDVRDLSLGFVFRDGIRAILPLSGKKGRHFGYVRRSTFAGCYGGIIADGDLDDRRVCSVYDAVCRGRITDLHLTGNPLHDLPESAGRQSTGDFTQILRLDRTFDEIFTGFSKGHRSSTKKGARMGVTVDVARDESDYRAYHDAYRDSVDRWGEGATSDYPWRLLEHGCRLAAQFPELIRLWVARLDGSIIAGAWVFYWKRHVDWWHGAARSDHLEYCASNVLQAAIIEDAVRRGYEYYDFNPSGGHAGVVRFKKRFGASEWPVAKTVLEGGLKKGLGKILRWRK